MAYGIPKPMTFEIHPAGRVLMRDGAPFFYLADTAWEMLHRLDREETRLFLQTRAQQGFTVIQTVILAELDGLRVPNRNGDLPFVDEDVSRPSEAYFAHVDFALEEARQLGLVLALLPTWGDKWNRHQWGAGPEVFTPQNAFVYGRFLGARYANSENIIWVLGGDRPIETAEQRAIIDQMAAGLSAGGSAHLKTFHPNGGAGSSQIFPDAKWLDFHMWQSGHGRNAANFAHIEADYALTPVKPVLDGEPGYEDHKAGFALENGFLDDYDCRKSLYWALFAGACGHTYGCHAVWQFWQEGHAPVNHPRRDWREALELPGAQQMRFARDLNAKWPFLGGVPAQELIVQAPPMPFHVGAIRGENGRFALFYFPSDTPVEIRLDWLAGEQLCALWFNPRSGKFGASETFEKTPTRPFKAPGWGPDWILVVAASDEISEENR